MQKYSPEVPDDDCTGEPGSGEQVLSDEFLFDPEDPDLAETAVVPDCQAAILALRRKLRQTQADACPARVAAENAACTTGEGSHSEEKGIMLVDDDSVSDWLSDPHVPPSRLVSLQDLFPERHEWRVGEEGPKGQAVADVGAIERWGHHAEAEKLPSCELQQEGAIEQDRVSTRSSRWVVRSGGGRLRSPRRAVAGCDKTLTPPHRQAAGQGTGPGRGDSSPAAEIAWRSVGRRMPERRALSRSAALTRGRQNEDHECRDHSAPSASRQLMPRPREFLLLLVGAWLGLALGYLVVR